MTQGLSGSLGSVLKSAKTQQAQEGPFPGLIDPPAHDGVHEKAAHALSVHPVPLSIVQCFDLLGPSDLPRRKHG